MSLLKIKNKSRCVSPIINSIVQTRNNTVELNWNNQNMNYGNETPELQLEISHDMGVSYSAIYSITSANSPLTIIDNSLLTITEGKEILFRITSNSQRCGNMVSNIFSLIWKSITNNLYAEISWEDIGDPAVLEKTGTEDTVSISHNGSSGSISRTYWEIKRPNENWEYSHESTASSTDISDLPLGVSEIRLVLKGTDNTIAYSNVLKYTRILGTSTCGNYFVEFNQEINEKLVYIDCSGNEQAIDGITFGNLGNSMYNSTYICAKEIKSDTGWKVTKIGECNDTCKEYELSLPTKSDIATSVTIHYIDCNDEEKQHTKVIDPSNVEGSNTPVVSIFCGKRILRYTGDSKHSIRVRGLCEG